LPGGFRHLYGDLLAARRDWPALRDFTNRAARLHAGREAEAVLELVRGGRQPEPGKTAQAFFNLTGKPQPLPKPALPEQRLLFSSEARRYQGERREGEPVAELLPYECVVFGPPSWKAFGGPEGPERFGSG